MYNIPTLSDLFDAHKTRLESRIGQKSPTQDKAFLKVVAKTEAAEDIGLYKYAADRVKANLALTAQNSDLDNLGNNKNTPRKPAQACIVTATLTATTGTIIPTTADFVFAGNNLRYKPTEDVTAVADVATLELQCVETGSDGNLDIDDTLQIQSQIAGAQTVATVTVVDVLGVDKEADSVYRPRVLFAYRAVTGGANATDHKIWAQEVTGVRRAFPYSGRPSSEGNSFPGDRQMYIEATSDLDPEGIADQVLLDAVRQNINYDPITGESRAPLGITDARLWVESIFRTGFYVEIRNFSVEADKEFDCKNAIDAALTTYFDSVVPFVDGVDLVQDRTDEINNLSVSSIVFDVVKSFGAATDTVGFGTEIGAFLTQYTVGMGELTKLISVSYP